MTDIHCSTEEDLLQNEFFKMNNYYYDDLENSVHIESDNLSLNLPAYSGKRTRSENRIKPTPNGVDLSPWNHLEKLIDEGWTDFSEFYETVQPFTLPSIKEVLPQVCTKPIKGTEKNKGMIIRSPKLDPVVIHDENGKIISASTSPVIPPLPHFMENYHENTGKSDNEEKFSKQQTSSICKQNSKKTITNDIDSYFQIVRPMIFSRLNNWKSSDVWGLNFDDYYDRWTKAFNKLKASEHIRDMLTASFATALSKSDTGLFKPLSEKSSESLENAVEEESGEETISLFNLNESESAFLFFSAVVLVSWLLHLKYIFQSAKPKNPISSFGWDVIDELFGCAEEDTLQFPWISYGKENYETPSKFVTSMMETFHTPIYTKLQEHYDSHQAWDMVKSLWTLDENVPLSTFIIDTPDSNHGIFSDTLTGTFPSECKDTLICYASRNDPFHMINPPKKAKKPDGDIAYVIHVGQYPEDERGNIGIFPHCVYFLGHLKTNAVATIHQEFLGRFFSEGIIPKDRNFKNELIHRIRCSIEHFWGFCDGVGDEESYDGFKFLLQMFADYVRAAWFVDHVLSSHAPHVQNNTWKTVAFRSEDPNTFFPRASGNEKSEEECLPLTSAIESVEFTSHSLDENVSETDQMEVLTKEKEEEKIFVVSEEGKEEGNEREMPEQDLVWEEEAFSQKTQELNAETLKENTHKRKKKDNDEQIDSDKTDKKYRIDPDLMVALNSRLPSFRKLTFKDKHSCEMISEGISSIITQLDVMVHLASSQSRFDDYNGH